MARNRILYFDLLLFLFAAFVLLEGWLFHLLFVFFLLLPFVSLLFTLPLCYAVRVRLASEEDLTGKGSYTLELAAQNRSMIPCSCVRVVIRTENLLGRSGDLTEKRSISLQTSLRPRCETVLEKKFLLPTAGRTDITVEKVFVCDPLGLVRLPVSKKHRTAETMQLYVLPEPVRRTMEAEKAADLGRDSDTYSLVKAGNDPAELFQLREYRMGDARHSIHWKLSGRWDRLIVREFGLPLSASVCFLVALHEGVRVEQAESVIATVLSVSEDLLAKEIPHRMGWIGEDGALTVRDIDSQNALAEALHALLALPASKQGETLLQYLSTHAPEPEQHLLLFSAGRETDNAAEDRAVLTAAEGGFCRRFTILSEGMDAKRAEHLRSLGAEAYLLDGRRPDAEEVRA